MYLTVVIDNGNLGPIEKGDSLDHAIYIAVCILYQHLLERYNSEKLTQQLQRNESYVKDCLKEVGWYLLPDGFEVNVTQLKVSFK